MRIKLEGFRTQAFDKTAVELDPQGDVLYWKTYAMDSPTLHRRDAAGGVVDFSFGIGSIGNVNYRASTSEVVTAQPAGGTIDYLVYDAFAAGNLLGMATFPAPTDGEQWWAYALADSTVYVITNAPSAGPPAHTISTFAPGSAPSALGTLEGMGIPPGELLDFDVDGSTMMVIDSGQLWRIDLTAQRATAVGNTTEITGTVSFSALGVVWEGASGLSFLDYRANSLRDISQELLASTYQINETYKDLHHFSARTSTGNFGLWNQWLLYTGIGGVFGYNLSTGAVAPVLLDVDDAQLQVAYAYPVALDNGTVYVVGLTSTSDAVGADGPVYQTDLGRVLAP